MLTNLQVLADLFTFTKEILKENITFHGVSVSPKLLCLELCLKKKSQIQKSIFFKRFWLWFWYVSLLFLAHFHTRWYQIIMHLLNFQLQVCLSMYAILLSPHMKGLKIVAIWTLVLCRFFTSSLEWKSKGIYIKCLKSCCASILVLIIQEALK